MLSMTFFTSFSFTLPYIYPTAISVLELLPTLANLNIRFLSLIRLLISAIFGISASINPSLDPLKTLSFSGSSTLRPGYSLRSRARIPSYPSIIIQVSPARKLSIKSCSLSISIISTIGVLLLIKPAKFSGISSSFIE